jgi:hypothetical protein
MKITALALALGLSTAMTGAANATVSLNVDGGKLVGASGVVIGRNIYNVEFKDGTCAGVYGSCENRSFDFTNQTDAASAAQALVDQVFVDGAAGNFDSDPSLTFGCSASFCETLVTYSAGVGGYKNAIATNAKYLDYVSDAGFSYSSNLSGAVSQNFARFSLASIPTVPEPATWAMMLVGFGFIAGATRYRRKSVKASFA